MADSTQKKQKTSTPSSLTLICKRNIRAILAYAILLFCLWHVLQQIPSVPYSSASIFYATVIVAALVLVLSMASAVAVMVPATLVIWITAVVMLAFIGKSRRSLVVEARKITKDIIVGFVAKILLKEGNVLAAICGVLGYFAIIDWIS